ncbi:MAG: hypothetical protein HZA93_06600 [Verrucomicrobia bacterium]|nr:hypothetical protein [Verrucomicrobiota bacterium]
MLAFDNLSDDKSAEYFSDGISEELLNALSRVPGLKVPARTSAFHFKGKNTPIPEIAKQLGVAYIVEGSVRKLGDQITITAKLINAADGFQVWSSGNIIRELRNILSVQEEIAGLIAANLQLKLGESARTARAVNPEAYRRVLEGRHFVALRSDESFGRAEKRFAEAVQIDPEFALAHAGVAEVAVLRALYRLNDGHGPAMEERTRARAAAKRAMDLDGSLAEPHASLGLLHFIERRWLESERHYREAVRLNPNYATAYHWHGLLLAVAGEFDRALVGLERAISLDPLAHSALYTYGYYLWAAGRPRDALAFFDRALAVQPEPLFYHGPRAVLLLELGRTEEALATARRVRENRSAPRRWWADGDAIYVLAQAGGRAEAEAYLLELRGRFPADSHLLGYALCSLGSFKEGLRLLETVEPMCQTRLYTMPWARPLHGSAEFGRLMEKLNSTDEYRVAREKLGRLNREAAAGKK